MNHTFQHYLNILKNQEALNETAYKNLQLLNQIRNQITHSNPKPEIMQKVQELSVANIKNFLSQPKIGLIKL